MEFPPNGREIQGPLSSPVKPRMKNSPKQLNSLAKRIHDHANTVNRSHNHNLNETPTAKHEMHHFGSSGKCSNSRHANCSSSASPLTLRMKDHFFQQKRCSYVDQFNESEMPIAWNVSSTRENLKLSQLQSNNFKPTGKLSTYSQDLSNTFDDESVESCSNQSVGYFSKRTYTNDPLQLVFEAPHQKYPNTKKSEEIEDLLKRVDDLDSTESVSSSRVLKKTPNKMTTPTHGVKHKHAQGKSTLKRDSKTRTNLDSKGSLVDTLPEFNPIVSQKRKSTVVNGKPFYSMLGTTKTAAKKGHIQKRTTDDTSIVRHAPNILCNLVQAFSSAATPTAESLTYSDFIETPQVSVVSCFNTKGSHTLKQGSEPPEDPMYSALI
eukprot:Platyproteum_vivax@DN7028_c0_g2_i1.p1